MGLNLTMPHTSKIPAFKAFSGPLTRAGGLQARLGGLQRDCKGILPAAKPGISGQIGQGRVV